MTRYVSNSEVQTFKRCKRKWWLTWHLGYQPKHTEVIGVRKIGTRIHAVLEHVYRPGGPDFAGLLDIHAEIAREDEALIPEEDTDQLKKFRDNVELERIVLEGYEQWVADTGVDEGLEVIAPEVYLEAQLPSLPEVTLIGKIDVRVRTPRGLGFLDHKSVDNFNQPVVLLQQNEQMLHYLLLHVLNFNEYVDVALYNMLRRVKRTARAKPPFYAREEVRHSPQELRAYQQRLTHTVSDMLELSSRFTHEPSDSERAYPTPHRDCTWDCPFFSICPMFDDGSRVDAALNALFVQEDPLSYYQREALNMKGETEWQENSRKSSD